MGAQGPQLLGMHAPGRGKRPPSPVHLPPMPSSEQRLKLSQMGSPWYRQDSVTEQERGWSGAITADWPGAESRTPRQVPGISGANTHGEQGPEGTATAPAQAFLRLQPGACYAHQGGRRWTETVGFVPIHTPTRARTHSYEALRRGPRGTSSHTKRYQCSSASAMRLGQATPEMGKLRLRGHQLAGGPEHGPMSLMPIAEACPLPPLGCSTGQLPCILPCEPDTDQLPSQPGQVV